MMAPFYELLKILSDWLVKRGVKRNEAQKYITSLFIALSIDSIYVSDGKRGQEIRVVPNAFTVLLDASFVTLTNYD